MEDKIGQIRPNHPQYYNTSVPDNYTILKMSTSPTSSSVDDVAGLVECWKELKVETFYGQPCHRHFKSKSGLSRHSKVLQVEEQQLNNDPVCSYCKKTFSEVKNLNRHLKSSESCGANRKEDKFNN